MLCCTFPCVAGGRAQPFYHVLPDPDDRPGQAATYVAQVRCACHPTAAVRIVCGVLCARMPAVVVLPCCFAIWTPQVSRFAKWLVAKQSKRPPYLPYLQENIALEPLSALHRGKPGEGLF